MKRTGVFMGDLFLCAFASCESKQAKSLKKMKGKSAVRRDVKVKKLRLSLKSIRT